ncbi:MAG: hypothetical protein SFV51_23675 [Bryobacteraceae bacterium]|nr:hypothetical protein [Bryobacteraceae bacterium]
MAETVRPGHLFYLFKSKYQHGLLTAYYRDMVRQRILDTPAFAAPPAGSCEIHVLTSAEDWLNLIWALKSFYLMSRRAFPLCVHDDGTLPSEGRTALQRHFPHARIISRQKADDSAPNLLAGHPRCLDFRNSNNLALKIFNAIAFGRQERFLLLDSDILFFRSPTVLLNRIERECYLRNTVNPDVASAYTITPQAAHKRFGINLIDRFNSGLGLIHRASLRLDWLEEFLSAPEIHGHPWRIEQTLFALCSSRFGAELLPPEYAVRLDGPIGNVPCRHYVGRIRHRMYSEGIRHLESQSFLQSLETFRLQAA